MSQQRVTQQKNDIAGKASVLCGHRCDVHSTLISAFCFILKVADIKRGHAHQERIVFDPYELSRLRVHTQTSVGEK